MEQPENPSESKKPKDSSFSQQQLPAWQPILTAGTVLPAFFVIGVAFFAIGVGLLYFSNQVQEVALDYTDCTNLKGEFCSEIIKDKNNTEKCHCQKEFDLKEDMAQPVYMYYGLTNFYQNHRRYVKSRDESQLLGNVEKVPNDDCIPYAKKDAFTIVPCGAIANSLFNDVIKLEHVTDENTYEEIDLLRTGIAWESDKKYKFKNPDLDGFTTLQDFMDNKSLISPPDWDKKLWELDPTNPENNGLQNEDLIVWMRTAAFPNFRKLYRKIDMTGPYEDKLPKGKYRYQIDYNYRVKQFQGTKSVYLSQTSLLGGKNPFLGIAYMVVGAICLAIGIVFLFIHHKYGKLTSDMLDMGGRN